MKYSDRKVLAERKLKRAIQISKLKRHQGAKRIVPSAYSSDPEEKALGSFIGGLKQSKWHNSSNGRVFYPSLEEIAIDRNVPNIFEPVRTKETAISKLKETVDWIISNGRLPGYTIKDLVERKHRIRLNNLTSIKIGKLQGIWYPEYDNMMAEIGFPDFFGTAIQGQIASSEVSDLFRFYKRHGRVPSQLSEDSVERQLYRKLVRYRQIKQGKTPMKWNPEIDDQIKIKKIKNFFEV